ncbi:hypothetical protein Glove_21g182 [Diversispora epigaea]|uniref:Protein kinase domain-containing protein n=1 Tax=Diversispora epigaea TaxID=1348612 RepID=A0A397JM80_9GLOM|nr:hypothetical protein Glove_21g182 [Diversispora epigaea]
MVLCQECNREYTWHNWCKPCNSEHFKNNFDKWTSGNEKVDKFIRDAQLNADSFWAALIEWIPYSRFKDIMKIAKGGFGTIYFARWIGGRIKKWDIENQRWKRCGRHKVVLKKFENFGNLDEEFLNVLTIHLKAMDIINGPIRIYGVTKDPETNKYMMVLAYMPDGNIRDYLKNYFHFINWKDRWIGGRIKKWDIENQRWKRCGRHKVVLKKFENFGNLDEEFLNVLTIHLKAMDIINGPIRIYGVTKDPETNKYMMVLAYMPDGNIRDYLKNYFHFINWKDSSFINFSNLYISDFGLSKIAGQSLENSNNRNLIGVLPYIAPEVLCGEEYTKAADVYSFGIIVYEFITGFAPYYDVPHDINLARQICNGLRPKIPFHTPKLITGIIMRCWDARVIHRPTFEELYDELDKYHVDYKENNYKNNNEITIQIDNSENFPKNESKKKGRLWKWIRGDSESTITTPYNYRTHSEAIYTSRILNYSNLPEPKNEENFEKELEEITKHI